jgi:AmmeMemoRadiSam system protein A
MQKKNLRMSSLDNREKQFLLEIARQAVRSAAERRESIENIPPVPALGECAGAFVTLRKRARLRGCIGQIGTGQPLADVVAHSAKAAALEDSRFDPVRAEEVQEIQIEISVLSPLQEIAPERIEAGKHGLLVSKGWQRGLLLPQVAAECRWTSARFLEETCVKAGLERNAWREPDTKIQGFTAEVFSESDFREERSPEPEGPAKSRYSTST